MDFQQHREIIKNLKRQLTTPPTYDMLSVLLSELQYTMEDNPDLRSEERKYIFTYSGFIKNGRYSRWKERLTRNGINCTGILCCLKPETVWWIAT